MLKIQDAKMAKNSPSAHHRPTLSGYIFATKACIDNRKKNLLNSNTSSTSSHNTVNVREFGAPQQISTDFAPWLRYCTDVGQRRSAKLCTIFGRLLGCSTPMYTLWGALAPNRILPGAKFTLRPSLALSYCILAALLHGTRAVDVSQTLRHGIFTRQGGHPVRHWAVEPSSIFVFFSLNGSVWWSKPVSFLSVAVYRLYSLRMQNERAEKL